MTQHSRLVERVRHELKFRVAKVLKSERITPQMARITLASDDFESFISLAYDDHCKCFSPRRAQPAFRFPSVGKTGSFFPTANAPKRATTRLATMTTPHAP